MSKHYQAAVIGGGPGGYVAAIRLAQLGVETALIEKDKLGGTCLNRGCIPTKALLHSAKVYKTVCEAERYGVNVKDVSFDYAKICERKDSIVTKLRQGIEHLEKKAGVDVIRGEASFKDKNTLAVGGETITADQFVIATGSVPAKIPIPGIDTEGVMDSDAVFAMKTCPKSAVIIGGGVIGVELVTLFQALGAKAAIVEMMSGILPAVDEEIAGLMRKALEKRGVDIYTGAKVEKIEAGVRVHFDQNGRKCITGEVCIIAVGRRPVTDGLGLENLGINISRGHIEVDGFMRTNAPNIYAVGDVTGKVQLAHVASAQGLVAAQNIAGGNKKMDYHIIPSCVYTEPEIAGVGLTEAQAREKTGIRVGRFATSANGRSMIMGESAGLSKIITDEKSGEILGCHIMAPHATDMIGEVCTAMRAEGTIEELIDTVHAHPTVSEMIMEAAHDTEALCIHQ